MSKEKGIEYREQYAKQSDVKVTASGLMYRIETPGSDVHPSATDTVEVHYRGTLVDGTEFDSSYSRNQTASFPLNRVIAGWTEGLQLIGVGGEIELVIPPELGYGSNGAGGLIGPDETLVFKVELIAVGS